MASYSVKLRSGDLMPMIGLGTSKATDDEVVALVTKALEIGYRHIDTAYQYGNEKAIGRALQTAFQNGIVKRNEIFITTKLPVIEHKPDKVRNCLTKSMEDLGVSYVDLYLIHWPAPVTCVSELSMFPNENEKTFPEEVDHCLTWEAMESLVDEGLAKNIGLSNFNSQQIKRVYDKARIKPSNLQVECHVYLQQEKLLNFCRNLGISLTAYAPLGSPSFPDLLRNKYPNKILPEFPALLENSVLKEIAVNRGKTTAQVALRYLAQRGVISIPKSVSPVRLRENFEIFNFDLTEEDMAAIRVLERSFRYFTFGHVPGFLEHSEYPFKAEF